MLAGSMFAYTWKGSSYVRQSLLNAYAGPGENLSFAMNKDSNISTNSPNIESVAAP